ncbi:Hypothetical protein NocV09_04700010, partial [Nannochloropsis oceanica]
MGVKGLLAFLQRRIQWDDERRASVGEYEYGWEPLAGKSLLVDGNAVIMWLAERAFEGKAGRKKGGRKGDGNGKRCALWMGGYEWYYSEATAFLRAFQMQDVKLTFIFDNRLGTLLEEGREEGGEGDVKEGADLDRLLRYYAVLSGDSDFLVYSNCRLIPLETLRLDVMKARVLTPAEVARLLSLPPERQGRRDTSTAPSFHPSLLPAFAMVVGNDHTLQHPLRPLLLRHLGLFDSPHITDILPLFLSSAPPPYSSLPPSPSPSPSPAAKTLDIIESFLRRHPAFARVWRQTMASYNHEDKILPSSLPPSASSSFRATVAKSQEQARGVLEEKGLPPYLIDAVLTGRISSSLARLIAAPPPSVLP